MIVSRDGLSCGDDGLGCTPVSAADFGSYYVDGNGAIIRSPLTADQNALYLAAMAAYQQCEGLEQGTPKCPVGSFWAGTSGPNPIGSCVSDYTGQEVPNNVPVYVPPNMQVPTVVPAVKTVVVTSPVPVTVAPNIVPSGVITSQDPGPLVSSFSLSNFLEQKFFGIVPMWGVLVGSAGLLAFSLGRGK